MRAIRQDETGDGHPDLLVEEQRYRGRGPLQADDCARDASGWPQFRGPRRCTRLGDLERTVSPYDEDRPHEVPLAARPLRSSPPELT